MGFYALKRLKHIETPLRIRYSIRAGSNPSVTFRQFICPFPWALPVNPPHSVEQLVEDPSLISTRQADIIRLYEVPLFRARDTPLRSLYRLYAAFCAEDAGLMRREYDYLYYHTSARWRLENMPDPHDRDPLRYAVLASLVEALTDAFDFRQNLGIRRDRSLVEDESTKRIYRREWAPEWTNRVAAIKGKGLRFVEAVGTLEPALDRHFLSRNVEATLPSLYRL